jgi:hypothetical protein
VKKSWLLFLALPLAMLSAPSADAATCSQGSYSDYVALGSGGCTIGDKTFFNFSFVSGTGESSSAVTVVPVSDGTNFGFNFIFPSVVGIDEDDYLLGYTVATIGNPGPALIKDVSVNGTLGASAGAAVSVAESVCIGGTFSAAGICSSGDVEGLFISSAGPLGDSVEFDPVNIVGLLKDINLNATTPGSTAQLTALFNTVSQTVPEPGTLLLLGSALAGVAVWGRKKTK